MTVPTRTPLPIIPPPASVNPGPTRDLLSALHQHDWYAYPATAGKTEVVSPDRTRSLTIHLLPTDELLASREGQRMPLPWAIRYVRGDS